MDELKFEKELKIDREDLDSEWLSQPQLYFRYAKKVIEAEDELSKVKEKLDICTAELDAKIRERAKLNDEKITEKLIENKIIKDEDHSMALKEFNRSKSDLNLLQAGLKAIEQRKSALENLVKLYCAGYFSSPREPKDSKESIKEQAVDKKQYEKLDKKRRV